MTSRLVGRRARLWPALVASLVTACGAPERGARPVRGILLVVIDTLRADHLGCYGYFRDTSPVIDALARESVFFELALSPVAVTLPAHTSILTGTQPLEHGVLANLAQGKRRFEPRPALRSFAQFARARGFQTAAFVSAATVGRATGIAEGFDHFDESPRAQRSAEAVNRKLLPWIDGLDERPFFLWVHYYDTHLPYAPVPPFDTRYRSSPELDAYLESRGIADTYVRPNGTEMVSRDAVNAYDGEIAYVDQQLGRLFAHLERRGLWDETAVILLSDHGESIGDHGTGGHGVVHREQLHVPMMMRIPGQAPRRVPHPVSTVDALPTALALLGDAGWGDFLEQASGADALASDLPRPPVFSQQSARSREALALYSLATDRWKLVHGDGEDRLYDWESDPFELEGVPGAGLPVAEELRFRLLERVGAYEARAQALGGDEAGAGVELDPEQLEKLRALGYAE